MPFNLLLLPLLGGYIFITNWNRTRFDTKRHTGERLLFHAAVAGVALLVLAFAIVQAIAALAPHGPAAWGRVVPFPFSGTSLLALVLGALLWLPANLIARREREAGRTVREWGDELELLFKRALTETRPVSITLKGGKVYIGLITRNYDPAYDRRYISLLPLVSGYRESSDHRVVLTTSYTDVYIWIAEGERPDLDAEDFEIVIPVTELQSANLFDWDAYDEFERLRLFYVPAGPED